MTRPRTFAAVGVAVLVLLAGCGGTASPGNETEATDTTEMDDVTTTTEGMTTTTTDGGTTTADGTTTAGGGAGTTTNVTFENQTSNGSVVVVANASLPDGGFVVIHRSDDGAAGEVIGNSTYLEPGVTENVTIRLDPPVSGETELIAMAHRDTNGNQAYEFPDADGPYTRNGSAVVDPATITVSENATTTAS